MFDRLAVKLEDRPVASKFLQQLREVLICFITYHLHYSIR